MVLLNGLVGVLALLLPVNITKSNDDVSGGVSYETVNFTGYYDNSNLYDSLISITNFRNNTYGYTYNFDINMNYDEVPTRLYHIEFQNDNTDGGKFFLNIEQNNKIDFSDANFVPYISAQFYDGSTFKFALTSKIFTSSSIAYDYNTLDFTGLYLSSDRNYTGTVYNSQYYSSWYNFNQYYDTVYFILGWQYKERFINSDGSYYDGYEEGYKDGGEEFFDKGYNTGYSEGYNYALDTFNESNEVFVSSVASILEIGLLPVNIFMTLLDIEVFGINIGAFVSSLITIVVITILLRTLLGGKGGKDE